MNITPIISSNYNHMTFSSKQHKKYDENGFLLSENESDNVTNSPDENIPKSVSISVLSSIAGAAISGVLFLPSFDKDSQIQRGMQKFEEEIFDSYSLDNNELSNNDSVNNQTKVIKFDLNNIDVISEFKDMFEDIIE